MSLPRRLPPLLVLCLGLVLLLWPRTAPAQVKPLSTAVIKSTTNMCLKGKTCHRAQAGVWVPPTKVAILAVSIAEQTDLALYVDIEVSTRPAMYMCAGNDSKGCIARAKYAGPGLFSYGATSGSTYLGSNITNTYTAFPDGYGIIVDAGTPVYVHLDARNGSLIDVVIDQDAWLYYVPVN